MFVNFGEKESSAAYRLVHQLRQNGISAELYPESSKIQKQMKYANDTHAQFVALLGESELENEIVLLKNMLSGEQQQVSWSTLVEHFKR
jgi:histidyl-tRNA synthetase